MTYACRFAGTVLGLVLSVSALEAADVETTLCHLRAGELWGEITLNSGGVRQIQVRSLSQDTVAVREVIGALHVRSAIYPMTQIRTAREIGEHRIPQRTAPFRKSRSTRVALGLDLILPGAGFFYAGDSRQGYTMLGFAALVVGTAIATGHDGAAGWVPIAAWARLASLAHLRDTIHAENAAYKSMTNKLAANKMTGMGDGIAQAKGLRLPLVGLCF